MANQAQIPTDISIPASLLANRARASMVVCLLKSGESSSRALAERAGLSGSGASNHLRLLTEGGMVALREEGRHRFFRLAGPAVARVVEALAAIAPGTTDRSPAREDFRSARTCYDHLAGRLGVSLTEELLRRRCIMRRESGYALTRWGAEFFRSWGIDLPGLRARHRAYAIPCLDGTERRAHLAGALGAALAAHLFRLDWLVRMPAGRALRVTRLGRSGFKDTFDIDA